MTRFAMMTVLLFLTGCGAPPNDVEPTPTPFVGFIHIDLMRDGIAGDATGLNLHFVGTEGDCWVGNDAPDWGEPGNFDDPIASVPLGGPVRQQIVYRMPIDDIYAVSLIDDWGAFTGEASIEVRFDIGQPAPVYTRTAPVAGETYLFDIAWPSREVTEH